MNRFERNQQRRWAKTERERSAAARALKAMKQDMEEYHGKLSISYVPTGFPYFPTDATITVNYTLLGAEPTCTTTRGVMP